MSLDPTTEQVHFCAEAARDLGDPLSGTATEAKVWFLLEYREPWQKKAVKDNVLPTAAQSHLDGQLAAVPDSRLLFIKQQVASAVHGSGAERRLFVARTDETTPALYEFELAAYEALRELDLAAVAAGAARFDAFRRDEPLFLVCTNGRRDRCCAKFGLPLYQALAAQYPALTWQSTHIGGHRYAPNVLFLPHSVNYGHLTPQEIGATAVAYLAGRLGDLKRYRGRTYYAPPVQAADAFLREALNLKATNGLRLRSATEVEEDTWRVLFALTVGEELYEVVLRKEMIEQPRPVSCSPPAHKQTPRFRLIKLESLLL